MNYELQLHKYSSKMLLHEDHSYINDKSIVRDFEIQF